MAINVIVPSNLGSEFDLGQVEAGKIHLKLDGTSLVRNNTTGVISASGQTIDGVLAEGHNIANIKNASGNTIANIKETVIAVSQTLNGIAITKEDGTVSNLTKVGSTSLVVDPTAKTLKSIVNGVESTAVDISALYADTNLIFDSYENYVLTFHKEDNTPVTINLEDLLPVVTGSSSTIEITGDGTSASPLSADIKLSESAGNILEVDGQGLIAKINLTDTDGTQLSGDGKISPLRVDLIVNPDADNIISLDQDGLKARIVSTSSATIDLFGEGTPSGQLQAEVIISQDAGNALSAHADGLYVATTDSVSIDSIGESIIVSGNPTNVNLEVAVATSATGNMLQKSPQGLKAILEKENTDTIEFSGNGTPYGTNNAPLKASVRIDTTADNSLVSSSNGLYVKPTQVDSTNTITVEGDGKVGTPFIFDVRLSEEGVNLLTKDALDGGLTLNPSAVSALATIEVQDAFGTPIYMAFPIPV